MREEEMEQQKAHWADGGEERKSASQATQVSVAV